MKNIDAYITAEDYYTNGYPNAEASAIEQFERFRLIANQGDDRLYNHMLVKVGSFEKNETAEIDPT